MYETPSKNEYHSMCIVGGGLCAAPIGKSDEYDCPPVRVGNTNRRFKKGDG